jgi:hypothetical protein
MNQLPECDRCLYNAHDPHILCAVHPVGVEESCVDFKPDPNVQDDDFWSPLGYSWYNGELIRIESPRFTQEEQLEILDSHPLFTGVCPQCGDRFDRTVPPLVHWDCSGCGWVDDSV